MVIMDKATWGYAFVAAFDRAELERITGSLGDAPLRYYDGAVDAADLSEQLTAVSLLKDAVASKLLDASDALVKKTRLNLDDYHRRLAATVQFLSSGKPTPKVMHFVWVGGSEVGAIQRDYMNIWRQVLASQGYTFNLWYDNDAVLAFEMNRVILDSARVHAMESGGTQLTNATALSLMIEDRARVLKQQMFDYLKQPRWAGRADEARIDLMVRAYGKDRAALEAFRQKCLDSHQAMVGSDLRLRDVGQEFADHYLHDVYEREVAMRGNFAAASDVVRLQAEFLEGGRYSDMDYLPPLIDKPGGVDLSGLSDVEKIGVLQLLLNHNDNLMPGRDRQRYADRTPRIPHDHQEALLAFARSKPGVLDLFVPPQDHLVPRNAIRLGTARGNPMAGEMNAFFQASPGSGMTDAIMQNIRLNYDCLYEVERRLTIEGTTASDEASLSRIAYEVVSEMEGQGRFPESSKYASARLIDAIAGYYLDGIRPEARGTITLTGPGAAAAGLIDYTEKHLQAEQLDTIRNQLKLVEGYNVYTEEEMVSGWTVNATSEEWLAKEQEKWASGKLKSRYAGNLSELMKEQTLTFKRGWPVIEGQSVLLTSVLQQLLNDLGEPFSRAMNDRLSGEITFNKPLNLGFDVRQQILAQPVAQPPVSIGAESLSNLNEAFTRIAGGKLPLEQLSPLHRVVLGGLFGAQQLDDKGFAQAWEDTRAFVENTRDRGIAARYDQIEQTLRAHHSPEFDAGLKTPTSNVTPAQNAYVLKAQAFVEPLSVRQWGEHIGRVESVARAEYQALILQRGDPVRARLFQAGAISAKQLPQDLLLRGAGDPGRRCYPLALLMAAAVEQGRTAQRTLIGKLATTNIAPQDPESHALLRVLDELRGVPMAQFGEKLGQANLAAVIQTLEAKPSTTSIMCNTQSHSLLVCKIVEGERSSYLFYDPNFGLYEFPKAEQLQRGIESVLADSRLAELYGMQDVASTAFDLIALDGSQIADKALPSQVTAGDLLRSEPVAGKRSVLPWQHHAALRTRALSENARLGRSVAELEGMHWAQIIESTTRHLLASQSLTPDYVPLYDTVKPTAEGRWTLSLINRKAPAQVHSVTVDDPRLESIGNWLQERFKMLGETPPQTLPHEPEAVNTLNAGFAILTLMEVLRQREGAHTTELGASMTLAVRLHSYVIYSQIAHGAVSDLVGVIKLVRLALLDERLIAQTTSSVLSRTLGRAAGEGVGSLLALANVGFDIYELATADNAPARTAAAVQLSFDVTALALTGSALAVGGSFAAFAGPLAVVVGGLGFGIGALARNFSVNLARMQMVGVYFYNLKKAYKAGGFKVEQGTLVPLSEAVITVIDLRTGQVTLGSQRLLGAHRGGPGLPTVSGDDALAINMRERWKLPGHVPLAEPVQTMVLPCTPAGSLGYEYQWLPLNLTRHDQGFDEARELEYDSHGKQTFWFDASTPFKHYVYRLFPGYDSTRIRIVLDEQCRSLYVPQMPQEWYGRLSYDIDAMSGQYALSLTQGVAAVQLTTTQDPATVRWFIRAPWVSETRVVVNATGFWIKDTEVHCAPGCELLLELERGQIFQMDWLNRRFTLVEQDLPDDNSARALGEKLTRFNHAHRFASPYLPLHNFKVPLGDPQWPVHTNAWFEAATDRILYARDLPPGLNDEIRLGAVNGDQVYFYHPDQPTLFRADADSGLVNRRYRLFNPRKDSTVLSCQELGEAIRVVQQVTDQENVSYRFDYLVYEERLELVAVSTTLSRGLPFDGSDLQWQGWESFVERFDAGETDDDASVTMGGDICRWSAAKFLSMQVHAGARTLSAWIRRRDDWFVTAAQLGLPNPLLMASQRDDDDSAMVFFDAGQKRLCTWQRDASAPDGGLRELLSGVDSVVSVADGYMAQTEAGMVFDLRNDTLALRALNQQWLSKQADWLAALATVVGQYGQHPFDIIGLSDAVGRALSVRYLEQRFLLVGFEQGRDLQALGATPDKQAGWLFAAQTGRVFRQPLLTLEQMRGLFGDTTRLIRHDLPGPLARVWPEWSFTRVSALGDGLRGETADGVILELVDGQPALITGVTLAFMTLAGAENSPEQRIARLIERAPHALFLRAGAQEQVFSWYDSIARSLRSADARADEQWVTYLGQTQDQGFLMYDGIDHLLFSNDRQFYTQRISARRNGKVLLIESSDRETRLQSLLMDGVDTLVLACGHAGMTCRVTAADWSRLDCMIVDLLDPEHLDSVSSSLLALEMPGLDRWQVALADGHLVLTDTDCGHSLILRNAQSLAGTAGLLQELKVHLWGEYRYFSVQDLFEGWKQASIDGAPCELSQAMDSSNEI